MVTVYLLKVAVGIMTVAFVVTSVVGCAGIRVSGEIDRVDESKYESHSNPVPMKCLFVGCDAVTIGEAKGS